MSSPPHQSLSLSSAVTWYLFPLVRVGLEILRSVPDRGVRTASILMNTGRGKCKGQGTWETSDRIDSSERGTCVLRLQCGAFLFMCL